MQGSQSGNGIEAAVSRRRRMKHARIASKCRSGHVAMRAHVPLPAALLSAGAGGAARTR
ncbi:hypothetical protein LMG19145_02234 [Xanthomonas arboricola pv. fragariae]|nr:hypothetical protein LMG19145_02234 [Xanthomonas arboricola pv. fragariae]